MSLANNTLLTDEGTIWPYLVGFCPSCWHTPSNDYGIILKWYWAFPNFVDITCIFVRRWRSKSTTRKMDWNMRLSKCTNYRVRYFLIDVVLTEVYFLATSHALNTWLQNELQSMTRYFVSNVEWIQNLFLLMPELKYFDQHPTNMLDFAWKTQCRATVF